MKLLPKSIEIDEPQQVLAKRSMKHLVWSVQTRNTTKNITLFALGRQMELLQPIGSNWGKEAKQQILQQDIQDQKKTL